MLKYQKCNRRRSKKISKNKGLKRILILIIWSSLGIVLSDFVLDICACAKTKIDPTLEAGIKQIQSPMKTLYSTDSETRLARSRELIKEGKYKEALSLLSPFISEPMKHPIIVSDYLAIMVWDGRYDDAIRMYENLPYSFPRRAYLMRNIAKAYYEKKEFIKAFSLYQATLKETPLDEEAQKGLVLSLISLNEYAKALESLGKVFRKIFRFAVSCSYKG